MKPSAFIFSNKWQYRVGRHLSFWAGRILFLTFAIISRNGYEHFAQDLFNNFIHAIQFATLKILVTELGFCYVVIYVLTPHFLVKKKYVLFVLFFLIDILFFVVVDDGFAYWMLNMVTWPAQDRHLYYWNSLIEFLNDGAISATIVFLCLKLFKTWYLKQMEGQMLAKANAETEMQILKAQVQPHFLFNTLNNIYSFTLNESPKAEELVSSLYEIMRYMVNDCNVELIELKKDLKMIEDYIELERVRYGRRLDIQINVDGKCQDKLITPLLMIPFVENSFKHGASKMLKDPWIQLSIQADEEILHFTLVNNKPAEESITAKKGIGLSNVKKRLELLYTQNHLLLIESTENTFTVNMQIPLYKMQEKVVV